MQRVPRLIDAADVPLERVDEVVLARVLLRVWDLLPLDQVLVPAVHHLHGTERRIHHQRRRNFLLVEKRLGELLQQGPSRRRRQLELLRVVRDAVPELGHAVVLEQASDFLLGLVDKPPHDPLDVRQIDSDELPPVVTVQRAERRRHPVLDHLHLHLDH